MRPEEVRPAAETGEIKQLMDQMLSEIGEAIEVAGRLNNLAARVLEALYSESLAGTMAKIPHGKDA